MLLRSLSAAIIVATLFFIVGFQTAVAGQAQPVYSLKNLGNKQGEDGTSYTRVQVKCNVRTELRYIHKASASKDWCVAGLVDECFAERIEAATKACVSELADVNSTTPPKKIIEPSAKEREELAVRRQLESELLDNEKKKLELSNRKLELRKQELELLKQKNTQ